MTTGSGVNVRQRTRHNYWYIAVNENGCICKQDIDHELIEGFSTLKNGEWVKTGGYRQKGCKIYRFEDQRNDTFTTIVIDTNQECFKFAEWCHDQIRNEKWTRVQFNLGSW